MSDPVIHSSAIVEDGAELAKGVEIGPFCCVGPHVKLGANVKLIAHVTIQGRTKIGANSKVSPYTVLGGAPQHIGYRGEDTLLTLGENNDIRENVTMNLGTVQGRGETLIGDNGLFMTGVHIGHDCIVHDNVIFANNATLGGHVIIGDYVFIGGFSGIHQNCQIGPYAFLGAMSVANHDLIPFGSANGIYADLAGLNLIGMKRRGMSRDVINELRKAYRLLFADEGSFKERMDDVASLFEAHPEVMKVIDFIKNERARPIMMPKN